MTEEINIHAAGVEFERGIVRRLLQRFNDHTGKQNRVRYAIDDVQQNGTTAPYHTETEGDDFVLYVGDKDTYLDPGDYRYRITYTTKGQVGFFPTYDEIYWNVNGNGWAFYIDSISAVNHLPSAAQVKQTAYYTGVICNPDNVTLALLSVGVDEHSNAAPLTIYRIRCPVMR